MQCALLAKQTFFRRILCIFRKHFLTVQTLNCCASNMGVGGMWFTKKDNSVRWWLYTIQTCIHIANCQFWFFLTELSEVRNTYTNRRKFIEHLGRVILHLLTNVKVFTLCTHWKSISFVMSTLESDKFEYTATKAFDPAAYVRVTAGFVAKLSWFAWFVATVVPVTNFTATFNVFTRMYAAEQFSSGNVSCSTILPYESIPPFVIKTKLHCGFGIMYQFVSILMYSWEISAHDPLFAGILIYIGTHLRIIREAFKSIEARSKLELGMTEDFEPKNEDQKLQILHQMEIEMRKCTRHLQTILTVCDVTESIFNFVALGQVLNTLFTMVSCLFLLSGVSIISAPFLAQGSYILGLLYQLFLYCWFGNEATLMSQTIPDGLYHSNWVDATPKYKRSLQINMMRMQRQIVFTAGKFTNLTLVTFVAILRGSYSYFAVLQNLEAAA